MYSISRNGGGIEFVPSLSILTDELTIYNFNNKFKKIRFDLFTLSESITFLVVRAGSMLSTLRRVT